MGDGFIATFDGPTRGDHALKGLGGRWGVYEAASMPSDGPAIAIALDPDA
jgi:hypothetical protein